MVAQIISGKDVAEEILTTKLKDKVKQLESRGIIPTLVVVLVGEVKASASYVKQKEKIIIRFH